MTPAIPSGPAGSAMTSVSGSSSRTTWSRVSSRSPGARAADDDPAVVDRRRVERVDRLAELEHHVVGGVDDVADRSLAGGQQAHLDRGPATGRPCTPLDPAADEPRAEVRLADLDAQALGGRRARLRRRSVGGQRSGRAGHRGDLAGEPDDRERVAAVRLDVDVEDDVAVELGERPPSGASGGQDQDPVGVGGQAELVARAEHPVADDAHLLGPLDAPVARQDGAGQRDRDPLAGGDVRRAADDLERLAVPTVTRVSDSRSARGWRSTVSSSPTTTFCQSAPQRDDRP